MSSAVICLLLVKDGSNDIPAWLRSVDPLADAVIALDDGSTDDTIAVLRANPLVQEVLTNSPSKNELGHDGVNHNRLLAAASTLEPEWIVFLDVEELLDEEDAIVLRQFLRVDAIPGFAYGLHQYRMWTDEKSSKDLYDPEGRYIYRVFAHDPTYRVPETHHPHPVPREIPPDRWMPTTVRVRHYGACTFQRLQSRLERMDLDRRRAGDFAKLDFIPNISLPGWQPRQSGLPVLIDVLRAKPADPAILDPEAPTFSVVILVGDDADTLTTRVGAVIDQECDEPFEVIVIVNGNRTFADEARHTFSTPPTSDQVRIIELKEPTPLGRMKNVGLAAARGDYIIFVEPEIVLAPGSLDCRRLAHLRGYGMVGGALQNGNGARAGWASYFLDQGAALPGRPAGEVGVLQGHWSYATIALRSVHGFAEHLRTGEDTVVNIELTRRGHRAWFEPAALAIAHPASRRPSQLLRHQFIQGRGLARHAAVGGRPRVVEAWGRMGPAERMQRITAQVSSWGAAEDTNRLCRVQRLTRLGGWAFASGFCVELAIPRMATWRALLAPTSVTFALVGLDRRQDQATGLADVIVLARAGFSDDSLRLVSVPRDLPVELGRFGLQTINAAYPLEGPNLFRTALLAAFGVVVEGSITIDFHRFRRLVDLLGGLVLDVPYPFFDPLENEDDDLVSADFREGRQRLDGRKALAYARSRRVDGDTARRHRQLDVVRAIIGRLTETRSPTALVRLGWTGIRSVRTTIPPRYLIRLALSVRKMRADQTHFDSVEPPLIRNEQLQDGRFVQVGDHVEIVTFIRRTLGLDPLQDDWPEHPLRS